MSFYQNTLKNLEKAAKVMKLDEDVYEILSYPKKILVVSLPIKMDNGRYKVFKGYRV